MQLGDFTYHRPKSLPEALALSARLGAGAMYLAGGTEAIPEMKRGRERPEHLISLRDLPELRGIRETDGRLEIGAMTSHGEVADSPLVRRWAPVLAEAAGSVGSAQIRRQGTIGGNFCGAVPCADTPPAAVVSGATLRLLGPKGARETAAETFFLGPRQNALEIDEVLAAILVPPPPAGSGAAYERFGLRKGMAVAVAAVAARLVVDGGAVREARVALGAVAPVPLRAARAEAALTGGVADGETFARAATEAAAECRPISDIRGSIGYRRELVRVLTLRALLAAARRAEGSRA
ncbi:MAG: xanthine dehydrogenase family protein subunit M [Planctomycetes bacterium]|nr:xanthine dehydrogenase family protein subunit M [Planctomycetota bacterium]